MTEDRALLDSGQVAAWLAMSRDSFCRKWRGLVAEHGFPPPVPGCGRHWDPHAIDRWLDLQLPAHLRPGDGAPPGYDTRPGAVNWINVRTGEPLDVQDMLRARIPAALGVVEEGT